MSTIRQGDLIMKIAAILFKNLSSAFLAMILGVCKLDNTPTNSLRNCLAYDNGYLRKLLNFVSC
jgi:hypothetical protein